MKEMQDSPICAENGYTGILLNLLCLNRMEGNFTCTYLNEIA